MILRKTRNGNVKKEIPVNGGNKDVQKYRKRVLNLLDKSLEGI